MSGILYLSVYTLEQFCKLLQTAKPFTVKQFYNCFNCKAVHCKTILQIVSTAKPFTVKQFCKLFHCKTILQIVSNCFNCKAILQAGKSVNCFLAPVLRDARFFKNKLYRNRVFAKTRFQKFFIN